VSLPAADETAASVVVSEPFREKISKALGRSRLVQIADAVTACQMQHTLVSNRQSNSCSNLSIAYPGLCKEPQPTIPWRLPHQKR
jgi:hypothetical protein